MRRSAVVIALATVLWWPGHVVQADPYEIETQIIRVAESARPSVVMITAKYSKGSGGVASRIGDQSVPGMPISEFLLTNYSGVVFDTEGRILTVASAVQNASQIEVTLADGSRLQAEPVGADDRTGLGMVRAPSKALKPLPLGDSSELKVGSWIIVIGNPFGLRGSVSHGIVSGLGRKIEGGDGFLKNMIQMTAPVNPGDAGGAVLDLRGRLVGIVHSTYGRAPSMATLRSLLGEGRQWVGPELPESLMSAEGINFAMPIGEVRPIAEQLARTGAVMRGWIGLKVENDEAGGVHILMIAPGSPAEKSGLRLLDRIIALDGKSVKDVDQLVETISRSPIGTTLQLTVIRDGKELSIPVSVANQPATQESYRGLMRDFSPFIEARGPHLGVLVQDLTPEMKAQLRVQSGALVVNVLQDSPAERAGIRSHDVITAIGGMPITSASDLRRVVARLRPEEVTRVDLFRNGEKMSIAIRLAGR